MISLEEHGLVRVRNDGAVQNCFDHGERGDCGVLRRAMARPLYMRRRAASVSRVAPQCIQGLGVRKPASPLLSIIEHDRLRC